MLIITAFSVLVITADRLPGSTSVAKFQAAHSVNGVMARWNFQVTETNRLGEGLVDARAEQSTLDDWSTGGQG